MEIIKKTYKIMLIVIIISICNLFMCNVVEASSDRPSQEQWVDGGGGSGGTGQTGGLPDLGLFEPTVSAGGATIIIGKILGILRIIGAIMTVVAIAVIGFNTILGSASEKAEYQQKLVGVIFAGIFLVASTSIAKMIMSVATAL